jgi:hypothetical protein
VTVLEATRVPGPARLDRINARAAAVDWRRVLLTMLMALPFALFYVTRLVVRAVGWVLAWLWAACMEGWAAAGPKDAG